MEKTIFPILLVILWLPYVVVAEVGPSTLNLIDSKAFSNLSAAISSPSTAGKAIVISRQEVSGNLMIPPDRSLKIVKGGSIYIASRNKLIVKGPLEAVDAQIFFGEGTVTGLREYRFSWFGGKGDNASDNTNAFIALHRAVNSQGGNCKIIYPPGIYRFSPQKSFTTNYDWRKHVELCDVKDIVIDGYQATIQAIIPTGWKIGDLKNNHGNDESPLQFRSSQPGGCANITIKGITIKGVRLTGGYVTDGNSFGIALRGVNGSLIKDVTSIDWSTDGLYIGASYGDSFNGSHHTIINSTFDGNMRQGVSVVYNDFVDFKGCTFSNTRGSSFGHGIDFEADKPLSQMNMHVTGCYFKNNERGSLNFIRTSHVYVSDNIMDEQHPKSNGAIYCDGAAQDINISGNQIITNRAALYIMGNNIHDFKFEKNHVETVKYPNDRATIRFNSLKPVDIENISIRQNEFNGSGGIIMETTGDVWIEDNIWNVSRMKSETSDCFGMSSGLLTTMHFNHNKIIISEDVTFSGERDIYLPKGEFNNNELLSHDKAIFVIRNSGAGRTINIGYNRFSLHFYYKGDNRSFDMKKPGTVTRSN